MLCSTVTTSLLSAPFSKTLRLLLGCFRRLCCGLLLLQENLPDRLRLRLSIPSSLLGLGGSLLCPGDPALYLGQGAAGPPKLLSLNTSSVLADRELPDFVVPLVGFPRLMDRDYTR